MLALVLLTVMVSAAANALNKGDVSIQLGPDLGPKVKTFIEDEGSCPATGASLWKRAPDVTCLATREIVYNVPDIFTQMGRQAYELAHQPGGRGVHVPVWQDSALNLQFYESILDTSNIAPSILAGISEDTTVALALLAFFSVFAVTFLAVGTLTQFVIEAKYFQVGVELSLCPFPDSNKIQCDSMLCRGSNNHCTLPHLFSMCSCQAYRCPPNTDEDFLCPKECGGDDGTGKCKGVRKVYT